MKIFSNPNENKVLQRATQQLNKFLEDNYNSPILLLLSGGSALQLAEGIKGKLITRSMTLSVLDERYSKDEKINNFAQIADTSLYDMLTHHSADVIDTRVQHNEEQIDLSQRLESSLKNWVSQNPKGKIIATLGMGEDGHIAGIMPYTKEVHMFEKLFLSKKWVVSYNAKGKNPHPLRVTTTMTFLKKIDHAVMYVVGDNKKEALDTTLREDSNLYLHPARIIHKMKDVQLFTDQT